MSVSNKDLVSALYIAVYNRAPEASGLNFWTTQLDENLKSFSALSQDFIAHPVFQQAYGDLSHRGMVEKFYHNVLGHAGDQEGINYWTAHLDAGQSVGTVLSEFLRASLESDLSLLGLSDADYNLAIIRQETLINKVAVSNYYADLLKDHTELAANTDLNSLSVQYDPKYKYAQDLIAQVDHNAHTVESAKGYVFQAASDYGVQAPTAPVAPQPTVSKIVLSRADIANFLSHDVDHEALGSTYAEVDYTESLLENLFYTLSSDSTIRSQANLPLKQKAFDFKDYLVDFNHILQSKAMVTELDYLLQVSGINQGLRPVELIDLKFAEGTLDIGSHTVNGSTLYHTAELLDVVGVMGLDSFILGDVGYY